MVSEIAPDGAKALCQGDDQARPAEAAEFLTSIFPAVVVTANLEAVSLPVAATKSPFASKIVSVEIGTVVS